MSGSASAAPGDGPREKAAPERLARATRALGLRLPPFAGPLDAFEIGRPARADNPVYLGGDLHATHPASRRPRPALRLDRSLDTARIFLCDYENESVEATAIEGIWCLAVPEEMLASAPYLILWDKEARLRTWVILPPARSMIGIGHRWLHKIPPPPGSSPPPRAR